MKRSTLYLLLATAVAAVGIRVLRTRSSTPETGIPSAANRTATLDATGTSSPGPASTTAPEPAPPSTDIRWSTSASREVYDSAQVMVALQQGDDLAGLAAKDRKSVV